ncbi:14687_t:CDS:10, partial [Acaulospora colombiana]
MSDGRPSASVSLHSSGVTSAEELAEKYQKLFSEFSRIKAQHSVLKRAVIKEQETNAALQDECKSKERELRSRLRPGWLVGSSKKELEKSKVTLEVTSGELTSKIEENEKLHKELYEVNSLYTQHLNNLQAKVADLEKKTEDLQDELTRSHIASEEALNMIRQEKRELDSELDQTRAELRKTKSLMEKNEQKMREDDDMIRAEVITMLSINLGIEESQNDQFNTLQEKIDEESNELIASFKQLQSSSRDYLKSLKEKSISSHERGLKAKDASQIWHRNLHNFAIKLTTAHNRVSELTAEKENLVRVNENDTTKVAALEKEIIRLKEELEKQKASDDRLADNGQPSYAVSELDEDQDARAHPDSKETGSPLSFEHLQEASDNEDDDDNGSAVFVYPSTEKVNSNSPSQSMKEPLYPPSTLMIDDTDNLGNFNVGTLELERDIGRVTKSEDDAKQRESLIKNHYEARISQLNEQLQLADSKSVRLIKTYEIMKGKLADAENEKLRSNQEISRLQHEISTIK